MAGLSSHPRRAYLFALALFVVAGGSGFLFRFALLTGDAFGISLGHLRQAHSHLMFMGWLTPALMALLFASLPRLTGREAPRFGVAALYLALLVAAAAYPAFLAFGYGPASALGHDLPLAAILSGLAMLSWYAVALAYLRARRGRPRTLALLCWDVAFAMLVWSTAGAWAQAAGMFLPMSYGLRMATLHLFLDGFGGGWFVFGLLGAAASLHPEWDRPFARRHHVVAASATPFTFLLALEPDLLSSTGLALRHTAGAVAGLALLTFALGYARRTVWGAALGLYGAGLTLAALPSALEAAKQAGLRLVFLHLVFLLAASTGVYRIGARRFGLPGARAFELSAGLLVATLLPLTWAWPEALQGDWRLPLATAAAMGPGIAALLAIVSHGGRRAQATPKRCLPVTNANVAAE